MFMQAKELMSKLECDHSYTVFEMLWLTKPLSYAWSKIMLVYLDVLIPWCPKHASKWFFNLKCSWQVGTNAGPRKKNSKGKNCCACSKQVALSQQCFAFCFLTFACYLCLSHNLIPENETIIWMRLHMNNGSKEYNRGLMRVTYFT